MLRHALVMTGIALVLAGCSPFQKGEPQAAVTPSRPRPDTGAAPVITSNPDISPPVTGEPGIVSPTPTPLPKERPKAPAATLSPASKALVSQAQAQRKKGDLPGATVTLERALRIEPSNPLLWIEMGRLRMDQRNYAQAEAMGRKALAMSVGDDRTQSQAWQLIADSLKARGKNPQAQEAAEKARALAPN